MMKIRQANLGDDHGILTSLAQQYLSRHADENRFRWLYRENPFGEAQAWIACDDKDEAVGMAAVFPRQMYREGTVVSGCVLGDLCVSPKYRSVGVALQLQRSCLARARSGEFAIAYDFPSNTMLGIYRYLGISPSSKFVRWVKPLRIDHKIERIFPGRTLSRPIAATVNLGLALTERASHTPPGVHFRLAEGPCTPEYSELADRVGSSSGICTVRNSNYLTWRYWQHPSVKYEFLVARRHDELLAYCVFTTADEDAIIAELFGSMDDQVLCSLLQELGRLLRTRGVASVSMPILEEDPRSHVLRKLGFWTREAAPVIGFARESMVPGSEMLLMHGDRES